MDSRFLACARNDMVGAKKDVVGAQGDMVERGYDVVRDSRLHGNDRFGEA